MPRGSACWASLFRPHRPCWRLKDSADSFPFNTRALLIGRRKTSDISLSGNDISTAHAVLFEMNGHRFIRDLGSRTGTYVNDVQVNGHKHALQFGDRIRIGDVVFTYAAADGQDTPESLDELEDLVGTAPIGAVHPELETEAPAAETRPSAAMAPPVPPHLVQPPRPARPAVPAAAPPLPPIPQPQVDLDAELAEPDLAEPADDTVALPLAPLPPTISPPALSPQVVDESEEPVHTELEWVPPEGTVHEVHADLPQQEPESGRSIWRRSRLNWMQQNLRRRNLHKSMPQRLRRRQFLRMR